MRGVCESAFCIGETLPLELRCNSKLLWCALGEIGDFGATTRALYGESAVWLCNSLSNFKTKYSEILLSDNFICYRYLILVC